MFRVLLVCSGNTCRSPMAEALLNRRIAAAGRAGDIVVLSAGLAPAVDMPASRGARAAMSGRGINLDGHRARLLLPDYIKAADLILVMTAAHKRAVFNRWPECGDKLFTLAEYAGREGDVADPFGGSDAIYVASAQEIENLLAAAWERIASAAGEKNIAEKNSEK